MFAQFYIIQYWTDPRLVGYTDPALPAKLWGPKMDIDNAVEYSETHAVFVLVNPSTGRLKRVRFVEGTFNNPMDLTTFPFDFDTLEASFKTTSTWLTNDESAGGEDAFGKTYRVRPVADDVGAKGTG